MRHRACPGDDRNEGARDRMKAKAAGLSAVAVLATLGALTMVVRAYQQDTVYLTDSSGQLLAKFDGYS